MVSFQAELYPLCTLGKKLPGAGPVKNHFGNIAPPFLCNLLKPWVYAAVPLTSIVIIISFMKAKMPCSEKSQQKYYMVTRSLLLSLKIFVRRWVYKPVFSFLVLGPLINKKWLKKPWCYEHHRALKCCAGGLVRAKCIPWLMHSPDLLHPEESMTNCWWMSSIFSNLWVLIGSCVLFRLVGR